MEIRQLGTRYNKYYMWEDRKNTPYNYEKNGLLNKILSPKITNTDNTVLKIVLQYYEKSLIFLMRYTDILKNFKNIHWKNR